MVSKNISQKLLESFHKNVLFDKMHGRFLRALSEILTYSAKTNGNYVYELNPKKAAIFGNIFFWWALSFVFREELIQC